MHTIYTTLNPDVTVGVAHCAVAGVEISWVRLKRASLELKQNKDIIRLDALSYKHLTTVDGLAILCAQLTAKCF